MRRTTTRSGSGLFTTTTTTKTGMSCAFLRSTMVFLLLRRPALGMRPMATTTSTTWSHTPIHRAHSNVNNFQYPFPTFLRSSSSWETASERYDLISSPQSATAKRIRALLQKRKKRMELGQTVVEGPRIVMDLLANRQTRHLMHTIVLDENKVHEYLPKIHSLLGNEQEAYDNVNIILATSQVMKTCSDTVTPQGILATVDIPTLEDQEQQYAEKLLLHDNKNNNQQPLYLVLDGVSDPGNTGTLLRTAVACGVAGVFQLPGCCDIWNPKAIRSAMSASFLVPSYSEMESWADTQDYLVHELGVQHIWAATMMGDEEEGSVKNNNPPGVKSGGRLIANTPHYAVNWCQAPTALVIGSEGSGLSEAIRHDLSHPEDQTKLGAVHIPMVEGIESLNAAVCGSVIMFEYLRQCQVGQEQ